MVPSAANVPGEWDGLNGPGTGGSPFGAGGADGSGAGAYGEGGTEG